MRYLRLLPILLVFVTIADLSAASRGRGKGNSQKAALAKIKKQDAARTETAQQYFNDIHAANPNVTLDQVKNMSAADVRSLYVKTYVSQGTPKADAIKRAESMSFYGKK